MNKTIIAAALASALASSTPVYAQYAGTLPPNFDVYTSYSTDSDDFNEMTLWSGTSLSSGFGARLGTSTYDGKYVVGAGVDAYVPESENTNISSDFSAHSTFLQLTFTKVVENIDFSGAIGVRRLTHSTDITDYQQQFFDQYKDLGEANGTNDYLVADAALVLTMTDSLSIGLNASTDVVDSIRSIQTGTTVTRFGADFDYLIDDNLTVNAGVGTAHYSDGNDRLSTRATMSWNMLPDYGISSYVRVRKYWNSDPWSLNYYSPEWLADEVIGVKYRKTYDGLLYTAAANYGRQQNAILGGDSESKPIYGWELGVQTIPSRKDGVTYGVSIIGSNSAGTNSGEDYNWTGVNFWLKAPL